jgi:hypothetical protein
LKKSKDPNILQKEIVTNLYHLSDIFIEEKISTELIEKIKVKTLGVLKHLNVEEFIEPFYSVELPSTLWKKWTFKQKLIWYWKQKLRFGKKELKKFYKEQEQIFCVLKLDPMFEEKYDQWIQQHKKYWYEEEPKRVIVCDIYFRPVHNTKHIDLTIIKNK